MKIGIYDPYLDSLTGGERYILTAASCLAKKHKVTLFWNDSSILEEGGKKLGIDLSSITVSPDIFSAKTPLIEKLKKTREFDRILFLSDGSIPFSLAKKTLIHFQFPVQWVKPSILDKIKIKAMRKVICNSAYTKKWIDEKFGVNSIILYPPCRNEFKKEELRDKKNLILSIGRYELLDNGSTFKKHEFLIDAFKKMVDNGLKGYELVLVISCKEGEKGAIKKLADSASGYSVRIESNLSHEEVTGLYKMARIYWHAAGYGEDLDEHPERAEHFGITTVEAMSAGAIPVVIDAGGQKEIVRDGEDGFLWSTEDDLMSKTQMIIDDNALQKTMGQLALERSLNFSAERFCKELGDVMK